MKKFLKNSLFFIAIITVINILYVVLLINLSPGFKKVYDISKFENKDYELIVIGNSMALDGVDASYITEKGINTYNLSIAGNHVSTSLHILERYLENNKKPKMVLIGLSSAVGKSYLNPDVYNNPEVDFFYKPNLWINIKNPPLLNFQWLAIDLFKIIISKDHRNATMVNGQWRTKKVIADNSKFNTNPKIPQHYNNSYFQKIVLLCEKNNIKVVVVEMTGSKSSQNLIPFDKDFSISNSKKIKVYNLNNQNIATELINPKTDWLAPNHLNVIGGRKATEFIFEKIIQPNYNK